MTPGRWYVLTDGTPVTWSEHVRDGVAQVPILAATCNPGQTRPWVVLWAPAGAQLTDEAVQWAQRSTTPGPVPPLRRPPPPSTRGTSRPALRVVRGDGE